MMKMIFLLAASASALGVPLDSAAVSPQDPPSTPLPAGEGGLLCAQARTLLGHLRAVQDPGSLSCHFEEIRNALFDLDDLLESADGKSDVSPALESLLSQVAEEVRRLAGCGFYGDLYLEQLLGGAEGEDEGAGASVACTPALVDEALDQYRQHLSTLLPVLQGIQDTASAQAALAPLQAAMQPLPAEVSLRLQVVEPMELHSRLGDVVEAVLQEAERLRQAGYFGVEALRGLLEAAPL